MSEETTDVGKAVELLSIATTVVQINRLAEETKPPASEVAALARAIAENALTRAQALLEGDQEAE